MNPGEQNDVIKIIDPSNVWLPTFFKICV